jgi:hypothetical protein
MAQKSKTWKKHEIQSAIFDLPYPTPITVLENKVKELEERIRVLEKIVSKVDPNTD